MKLDLSNPKVLKNFIHSQIKEGNGELFTKEKVLVFRDKAGNEFVAPEEMQNKEVKNEVKEEVKEESEKDLDTTLEDLDNKLDNLTE